MSQPIPLEFIKNTGVFFLKELGFDLYVANFGGYQVRNQYANKSGCIVLHHISTNKFYVTASKTDVGRTMITCQSDLRYGRHDNPRLQQAYDTMPSVRFYICATPTPQRAVQLCRQIKERFARENKSFNSKDRDTMRADRKRNDPRPSRYVMGQPVECNGKRFASIAQAARILDVSRQAVQQRCQRGVSGFYYVNKKTGDCYRPNELQQKGIAHDEENRPQAETHPQAEQQNPGKTHQPHVLPAPSHHAGP